MQFFLFYTLYFSSILKLLKEVGIRDKVMFKTYKYLSWLVPFNLSNLIQATYLLNCLRQVDISLRNTYDPQATTRMSKKKVKTM